MIIISLPDKVNWNIHETSKSEIKNLHGLNSLSKANCNIHVYHESFKYQIITYWMQQKQSAISKIRNNYTAQIKLYIP